MAELTDQVLEFALADPSEESLAIMRLSVVDWLSVGFAGRDEPVARIMRRMVAGEGGVPQAQLFGGGRAPARGAALVNGAASHALDYDDTHFAHIGHPSVAVLPAAFALGEAQGASFAAVLRAALAGCEASIRFGLAFGRGHYQIGFHQTATAGAFGASVAAAQVMGLKREQLTQALALVSTRASGLKSQFGTMGKPYNAGIAAANGVEAAQLAALGFLSSPAALDGPLGFLETHHCDGAATDEPGFLMDGISHKYHACCHGLHAALEAISSLKPLDSNKVEEVEVITHPRWMSVCNKPAPRTGLEAKFSYRGVIAASLMGHDTGALETFDDALWSDPALRALQERVQVTADESLSETQAKVAVVTADRRNEAHHDLSSQAPYAQRAERVRGKSRAVLGEDRANALWAAVHEPGAGLTDLAELMG